MAEEGGYIRGPGTDLENIFIIHVDDWNSRCIWCKSDLFHARSGVAALLQHARMASHKTNANLRKNRNKTQMMSATQEESANNNEGKTDAVEIISADPKFSPRV